MARVGGGRRHLKRIAAPKSWKIKRKSRFGVWVTKPSPGPHPQERSIPLRILVRDYLGLARNAREADFIIKRGEILVDGKVRKDPKFPVGLFDVVEIPKVEKVYRIILDEKGRLVPKEISESEKGYKIVRIERKKMVRGGRVQLGTHDGRSFLLKETDLKPGDVLKIEVPSQNIVESYKLEPGNLVYILSGRHAGTIGTVKEIEKGDLLRPTLVKVEVGGETIETAKRNVFVVGRNAPVITL
ncbi:MAG: 30S ribosomal protein S4e [Candidatus Diapherotrites archaeon]|nr:30S ribosomal protein S4e [Candidatus Diapherotrites archaeon]